MGSSRAVPPILLSLDQFLHPFGTPRLQQGAVSQWTPVVREAPVGRKLNRYASRLAPAAVTMHATRASALLDDLLIRAVLLGAASDPI